MAINPNIALAVKGYEAPDLLGQYGKIAAIQGAQQQNALAQLQMQHAIRQEEETNALNRAYAAAYNPQTGEIDTNKLRQTVAGTGIGSKLPAIEKGLIDLRTARVGLQESEGKVVDAALKRSREFLSTINPADPNAPAQYLAWHEANHKDPVLGPLLTARGVTAEQARGRIEAAIQQGPQAFADLLNQSKLGVEEFMKQNKPTIHAQDVGGTTRMIAVPGLGGPATTVQGSEVAKTMTPFQQLQAGEVDWKDTGASLVPVNKFTGQPVPGMKPIPKGMTPGESARLAQEAQGVTYHTDENGQIVALPSKLKPGQVPTAVAAMAPGGTGEALGAKPSEALTRERNSISQQQAIVKGALEKLDKQPDAFGIARGLAGETVGARMSSPENTEARSYLFNVVSGVIKERAGTAQSAAEAETLARFLPQPTDNADIIRSKLNAFSSFLTDKEKGLARKKPGQPAAPGASVAAPRAAGATVTPPPGFKLD